MPAPTLLLAPAAAGKTAYVLEQVRAALAARPLTPAWVIVPDRHQAQAFRRRIASNGGALGAVIGTFGDLYQEILGRSLSGAPVAPPAVIHRLLSAAIDRCAESGALRHYLNLRPFPGFSLALQELISELKRARIEPAAFAQAVQGYGPRLEELAALYEAYQLLLIDLEWADPEGLGWLAVQALQAQPAVLNDIQLLAFDGFDSFNPTQLQAMRQLAAHVPRTLITLSGDAALARAAYRRFRRTLTALNDALAPELIYLPAAAERPATLTHLSQQLFEAEAAPLPADAHITWLEAQTQSLEAREALRWLKARHVRDGVPLAECAVVARDLAPYRPFLQAAAREFGLPLRLAGDEPLAANPAIASLLDLLALPVGDWARRPLVDAVRSPFFNLGAFGLARSAAMTLEEVALWGQVLGGLAQWEAALRQLAQRVPDSATVVDEAAPPAPPFGPAATEFWDSLSAFARRFTPAQVLTYAEHAAWVEARLAEVDFETQLLAQPATAARDAAALKAFRSLLNALVLSEAILKSTAPVPYAVFLAELRGAAEAARYQADDFHTEHIYAAALNAARGVAYRAVAVLGLSEGLFPAPLTEDPFLADEERITLGLEPRLRNEQQSLFYEAVTRASDYLLLTRPYLTDDGEVWPPSPYWLAAGRLFSHTPLRLRPDQPQPLAEAASLSELLTQAVRARALPRALADLEPDWQRLRHAAQVLHARQTPPATEYEGLVPGLGQALSARYSADYVWSASRLESYGGCGFHFFVASALGLEARAAPTLGFDAAQLGSLLHAILEAVYRQCADNPVAASLLAALPTVAAEAFAAAPATYGFRPTPLWEQERAEILEMLAETLRALAEAADDYRPLLFEQRFGFAGAPPLMLTTDVGPVRLHGVIDRVDVNAAGQLRVIDYKTGASGFSARELVEGRRLQLPLYALAAEQLVTKSPAASGFYWGIRAGQASSLRLESFEHAVEGGRAYNGPRGAMRLAAEHIGRSVAGIRAGRFLPIPPPAGCPEYCPAAAFCWRYTPGR